MKLFSSASSIAAASVALMWSATSGFVVPSSAGNGSSLTMAETSTTAASMEKDRLFDPVQRDAHYGRTNMAQYLLDLHDSKATFDFCGGMMFQLVLTDALYERLGTEPAKQPVIFSVPRMSMIPEYRQSSQADDSRIFHGREIRQVPTAAGGMGMVLQLSLANGQDPQGWTPQELARYDGWGHDAGREWRKGPQLEQEGFATFRDQFGPKAYSLHHRFYWHYDGSNRIWLSAEDGCEGTPASNPLPKRRSFW